MAHTTRKQQATDATVEVLYQRMGNKWYAFSLIDDEVFMGEVPEEAISEIQENTDPNTDNKQLGIA